MPPSLADRLAHILEAIEIINDLIERSTADAIAADRHLRLALERAFEIVCEASRHVPDEIKTRETEIDWRKMADMGNLLRHAYHRVDVDRMIEIARRELSPLKEFTERLVREQKS